MLPIGWKNGRIDQARYHIVINITSSIIVALMRSRMASFHRSVSVAITPSSHLRATILQRWLYSLTTLSTNARLGLDRWTAVVAASHNVTVTKAGDIELHLSESSISVSAAFSAASVELAAAFEGPSPLALSPSLFRIPTPLRHRQY